VLILSNIIPEEGNYGVSIAIKEDDKISDQSDTGFSVKSDLITNNMSSLLQQFRSGIKVNEIQSSTGL